MFEDNSFDDFLLLSLHSVVQPTPWMSNSIKAWPRFFSKTFSLLESKMQVLCVSKEELSLALEMTFGPSASRKVGVKEAAGVSFLAVRFRTTLFTVNVSAGETDPGMSKDADVLVDEDKEVEEKFSLLLKER